MTVKIIACEVMKEELLAIQSCDVEYEFVSMNLHLYPKKLQRDLQARIDHSSGYSRVILAFGLCGGAAANLRAGDSPLIIPRVHDCIAIFWGSRRMFEIFSQAEKGTFYLTCGWSLAEKNILTDFQRVCMRHGEKKARSVLARMYDSYKQIVFIHTGAADDSAALNQSQQIARLLELRHRTMPGDLSYLRKIVNGPWEEADFIQIAPQAIVTEEMFGISANLPTN